MNKIAVVVITVVLVVLGSAAATAYPPEAPSVTVDNPVPLPGEVVVLTITGCAAGDNVEVSGGGRSVTVTAGADGSATVSTTAPTTGGRYTISVSCGGRTTTIQVTVTAPIPSTQGGDFRLNTTTPGAGENFVVSAFGWCGLDPVTVTFNGQSSTKAPDVTGDVSFVLTAPSEPGRYIGRISCGGGDGAQFTVVVGSGARGVAAPGDEIPRVGSDGTSTWLTAGVVTIAIGAGLLIVARARRRQDALIEQVSG